MVNLMRRRREMLRAALLGPAITDHVHDSMVLWLDGIENTRSGHDASASMWEDLSGNGRDYTYNAVNIINGDHFLANGRGITTQVGLPDDGTIKTVELVIGFLAASAVQIFIPLGNQFGTTYTGIHNSIAVVNFHATASGVYADEVYERFDDPARHTYNSGGYVDGIGVPTVHVRGSYSASYPTRLFCYTSSSNNVPACKIYALRLYSRQLTAAEIAKNAALDAARFGG